MAVSPEMGRLLAKHVLEIYVDAEQILLEKIAKRIARGIDEPGYYELKLLDIQALRREAEAVIDLLEEQGLDAVEQAIRIGYNRGVAVAGGELVENGAMVQMGFGRTNERAVQALVDSARSTVGTLHLQIRRSVLDVFRHVTEDTAAQVITGTQTRQEAARRAMKRYTSNGITGFVDKVGREWDLASYAEMATRTASGQAAVAGALDRFVDNGHDLVIVSNAPEECKTCRPWEGKVLSITGATSGQVSGDSIRGSGRVTITVAGSVQEATRDGLFHPNCRHSTSLYQPGITTPPVRTADPEGDKLRQKQRSYERGVRANKRQLIADEALFGKESPQARETRAHLRDYQAEFKGWREDHGRKNLAYRERLDSR